MHNKRTVPVGTRNYTEVFSLDHPGAGSAYHHYMIAAPHHTAAFADIRFQSGPIKEAGVNGAHNEDLLAIVIDRLQAFQSSPFACRENALALTKIEEALHWLAHRTSARQARGVEGSNTI